MIMSELLQLCIENKASDLHLSAGLPPMMRINGELGKINVPILESKVITDLLAEIMTESQRKIFANHLDLDFAFELLQIARFRVNVFQQARGPAAVLRIIPNKIASFEELGLPSALKSLCHKQHGLILVTGSTGSGKSTTLAAMIDYINRTRSSHIVTIEDPIEFIHTSEQSLIHQREVHQHTLSFNNALRAVLREDPDVILIGEMRDPETIKLALTAAETGHLVFSTLHTNSAAKTIHRIIDTFPTDDKNTVRSMLSESLQAVVCQTLIKRIQGGRIAASEIMLCTPAIRNLIREDKIPQIYSAIQTGQALGMRTMDMHLRELVSGNIISETDVMNHGF